MKKFAVVFVTLVIAVAVYFHFVIEDLAKDELKSMRAKPFKKVEGPCKNFDVSSKESFLFIPQTNDTKYKVRELHVHPEHQIKGHWIEITVYHGKLIIALASNEECSIMVTTKHGVIYLNLEAAKVFSKILL